MHEQAELLLRPVRAQQPTWPHSWRPLQLVMQDDALRYKQGKREVAIPLHHVTHVNVVDNERCVVATLSLSLAPRTAPLNTFPLPLYALPRWPPLTHSHPTPISPHPPASAQTSTHHTPHTTHHTPPHARHPTPPRSRCEFAILSRGRTVAFRAADASAMTAWVAVLRSKEPPLSPTGGDSPARRAAP